MFSLYFPGWQTWRQRRSTPSGHALNAGDVEGSRQAQERVTRLRTELYSVAFSPAAVKKALQIMGEDVERVAMPWRLKQQCNSSAR